MNTRAHLQPYLSNSLAIRQEIQRFESVHPSIYAIYDLIEVVQDPLLAQQIREHVVCIEDSFVNSQEWTLSRSVPDLRLGIVGSLSSGKSALVHRYLTGSYMQEESPEGGRFKKEIVLEGQSFLLLIRDEGGPPELQFTSWVDAVIFVFSLENEASFNAVYNYYAKMVHFRNASEVPLILVGTQDAISESNPRVIDDARARKLASDLKRCSYYETCATYGLNVERVFQDACQKIVQQRMAALTPTNSRPSTPNHSVRCNYYMPSSNNGFASHCMSNASTSTNNLVTSSPSHSVNNIGTGQSMVKLSEQQQREHSTETLREQSIVRPPQVILPQASQPSLPERLSDRIIVPPLDVLPPPKDQKDLPTPSSTPTTSRKTRRRSNLFTVSSLPLKKGEEEKKVKNGEVGSGRAIPIKQGHLYKRSCKPLNKDWKKKYVTLCDDGRLTYHPSLHDYMDDIHGKEIPLIHTTVKIPGQKPRGSRSQTIHSNNTLNGISNDLNSMTIGGFHSNLQALNKEKMREKDVLLTAYEVIREGQAPRSGSVSSNCEDSMVISNSSINPGLVNGGDGFPITNIMGSKIETPNVKKRHRRMKSSGMKNVDNLDDSDGYEFVIVSLDNKQWHFDASSCEERESWVQAIEQQILNSLQSNETTKSKSRMNSLVEAATLQSIRTNVQGNSHCADCDASNPGWASLNLGALICIECSGIHRNLGSHISRVRSLDLDEWPPSHISVMSLMGNEMANSIWEANTHGNTKPTPNSSREEKERWIRAKYELKEFLAPINSNIPISQQLIDAVCRQDIRTVAYVLSNATPDQVNATVSARDLRMPIHLACALGNLAITQLLIWHNANLKSVDQDGRTALTFARNSGSQDIQELLIHSGCPDLTVSNTLPRRKGSISRKTPEVFDKLPASII